MTAWSDAIAMYLQENTAIAELTVAETLDFSARTQGTGLKAGNDLTSLQSTQRALSWEALLPQKARPTRNGVCHLN